MIGDEKREIQQETDKKTGMHNYKEEKRENC